MQQEIHLPETIDLRKFYPIIKAAIALETAAAETNENRSEEDLQAVFDMWGESNLRNDAYKYQQILGHNMIELVLINQKKQSDEKLNPNAQLSPNTKTMGIDEENARLFQILAKIETKQLHGQIHHLIGLNLANRQKRDEWLAKDLSPEELEELLLKPENPSPIRILYIAEQALGYATICTIKEILQEAESTNQEAQ